METLIWILVILVAAAAALTLYRQRASQAPRLVFTLLPPYDIPDVILVGGVLVENRGHNTAPNVQVKIQYGKAESVRIQHMHVATDEPYFVRAGGEQYNFANIRLRQLRPGKRVVVYWAAAQEFQPNVSVTSFRPAGQDLTSRVRETGERLWQGLVQRRP